MKVFFEGAREWEKVRVGKAAADLEIGIFHKLGRKLLPVTLSHTWPQRVSFGAVGGLDIPGSQLLLASRWENPCFPHLPGTIMPIMPRSCYLSLEAAPWLPEQGLKIR